jgi:spermidine synthase
LQKKFFLSKRETIIMQRIQDGWFYERDPQALPGEAKGFEVEEVLFSGKSEFQEVLVFKSKTYGNILVLDGMVQCSDRDEFSYQEMIAHLPMCSHPDPKKVLVIGGGDGGVLREICRHPGVEEVTLCELDKMVVEVSKKYLPQLSQGFKDPRVKIVHCDGAKYLEQHENEFDVIIVDSSDPEGPANPLFGAPFFAKAHKALRDGGVMSTQGECFYLDLPFIKKLHDFIKPIFKRVEYAFTLIPSYPSGSIGFFVLSKEGRSLKKPVRELPKEIQDQLQYYNKEIHEASFVLPSFVRRGIYGN